MSAVGVINGNWKNRWNDTEPESQPLEFERDANAIYQELVKQAGADVAKARAHFLLGASYDNLCAGLLTALNAVTNAESETELVHSRHACPKECLLTPAGHLAYDEAATERGDALREAKYRKGL